VFLKTVRIKILEKKIFTIIEYRPIVNNKWQYTPNVMYDRCTIILHPRVFGRTGARALQKKNVYFIRFNWNPRFNNDYEHKYRDGCARILQIDIQQSVCLGVYTTWANVIWPHTKHLYTAVLYSVILCVMYLCSHLAELLDYLHSP